MDENSAEDAIVGTLSSSDDDLDQQYTYKLVESADGRFKIEGYMVKVI